MPWSDRLAPLASAGALDRVAIPLQRLVCRALPEGARRDALQGRWLGHPVHPALTDITIGSWTGAMVLDCFGPSVWWVSDWFVAMGCAAALPTAASGLADWSETEGAERRIGLVHMVANTTALTLYTVALVDRLRGRRARGIALSWVGAAAATAGGWLGGELVARGMAVRPDHAAGSDTLA